LAGGKLVKKLKTGKPVKKDNVTTIEVEGNTLLEADAEVLEPVRPYGSLSQF